MPTIVGIEIKLVRHIVFDNDSKNQGFLLLVFPAGILQPPFYHKESINFNKRN